MEFKKLISIAIVGIIAFVGIIMILPSIRIIEEGTIGVARRFGQATDILNPGIHFRFWVTHDVVRLDGRVQSLDIDFAAHTNDAQPIHGGVTVHYQVIVADAMNVVAEFGSMENLYHRLSPIFLAEAQIVLATKSAMELVENRAVLAYEIRQRLANIASQYRIVITNVILESLLFSPAFDQAVENRMIAEQQMLMADLERQRAVIQAEQYLEVQKLRNQAIIDQALADANALEIMQEAWGDLGLEVREAMLRQMFFERWDGRLVMEFYKFLATAVRLQEKNEGVRAVDYQTQAETFRVVERTYEDLKEEIKTIAEGMFENGKGAEYKRIVEEHIGKGKGVQDTDSSQRQLLELILVDLKA